MLQHFLRRTKVIFLSCFADRFCKKGIKVGEPSAGSCRNYRDFVVLKLMSCNAMQHNVFKIHFTLHYTSGSGSHRSGHNQELNMLSKTLSIFLLKKFVEIVQQ